MEIRRYLTINGIEPFQKWFDSLRDLRARAKIASRLARFEAGAFGDCRPVGSGVWEIRVHYGPGYRVYYAQSRKTAVLLLIGGDKSSQQDDIETAIEYWSDFQRRQS